MLLFRLAARVLLYDHPTNRMAHTTAFVTPVVVPWLEREIAQWVHPMNDRSDDPSHHEHALLPRSYISLLQQHHDRDMHECITEVGIRYKQHTKHQQQQTKTNKFTMVADTLGVRFHLVVLLLLFPRQGLPGMARIILVNTRPLTITLSHGYYSLFCRF